MKLIDSLDRACTHRMRPAARPRLIVLAIIGCAVIAPLLSGSAIAAATGEDQSPTIVASAGLLGGLALTGPLREEDPGNPQGGGTDPKADDPKLTIGQRLNAALASKASLQASIAERDTKIAEHNETITRLNEELANTRTSLDQANARITQLEVDAAEVDKALKTAEAGSLQEGGAAALGDDGVDRLKLGTLWLLSPVGIAPGSDPDGTWTAEGQTKSSTASTAT